MNNLGRIIISGENVHKTYLLGTEGVAALRGVSLDVQQGEMLVIFGTSGGGKSSLLNVLGTIDTPTKGNLALFGQRITDKTPDRLLAALRNKKIGFVFQSFNLLPTMTAVENVELPMIIAGQLSAAEIQKRAKKLLADVGLGHRLDHKPSALSGGEQQRVTIARALANDPEMLLLDEPTGDLDTKSTRLIMSILMNLNRHRDLTMVFVTHDVYMKQYADRTMHLRDGRVARLEPGNRESKKRAVDELFATVREEFGAVPMADCSVSDSDGNTGPRTHGVSVAPRRAAGSHTETRKPGFYDPVRYGLCAREDTFYEAKNQKLFQKLFPSKADEELDSFSGSMSISIQDLKPADTKRRESKSRFNIPAAFGGGRNSVVASHSGPETPGYAGQSGETASPRGAGTSSESAVRSHQADQPMASPGDRSNSEVEMDERR